MENLFTCTCGSQTWLVLDDGVRCTVCHQLFDAPHLPVRNFNRIVAEELREEEESNLEFDAQNLPVRDFNELVSKELLEEELATAR
ncbi:MAG: hypothetical protein ACE14M_08450 [Terriglobales bacterium]